MIGEATGMEPHAPSPAQHWDDRMYQPSPTINRGAARAILSAGPVFLTLTCAATLYKTLPAPIPVDLASFAILFLLLLFGLIFGPFVACIPILIGASAMTYMSRRVTWLSARPIWLATGLLIGLGAAHGMTLLQTAPELAFALVATCGLSAYLCHNRD